MPRPGAFRLDQAAFFVKPQCRRRHAAALGDFRDGKEVRHRVLDLKFTLTFSLQPMNTQPLYRTALITGASRGLGLALSRALAARGWNLIITAHDPQRLRAVRDELAVQTHVAMLAGDITDAGHRSALAVLARGHAGLDAVVNNAGILGPSPQPELLNYPIDVLMDVYATNVIAPLALLQAVRSELKPNARIINITSDAAVNAYSGWGGYGSSKAAFEQLSAIIAVENPQVRVYWADPGDMRTDMQQAAFPGEDISDRALPESRVPGLVVLLEGNLPSGRYVSAEIQADVEIGVPASTLG